MIIFGYISVFDVLLFVSAGFVAGAVAAIVIAGAVGSAIEIYAEWKKPALRKKKEAEEDVLSAFRMLSGMM